MKPKNLIPRMKLLSLLLVLAVLLSLQPAVLAEGTAAAPEEAPDSGKTMSIAEIVAMVTAAAHEVAEKARHFTIPEDALVAPKPIEECYGTCSMDHPEVVMDLIQRARDSGLLGQDETVAFRPDANFYHGYHGRNFEYYLDDTIMVILWKENVEGKCCSFAEVKIADASQFRRKLANDSFGPGPQFLASELGEQVNAVVTMNADYYRPRHYGIVVYNRELCRFETDYVINNCLRYNCVDSMFVTASGDFLYKRQGEEDTLESISAFIQENDILFSLAFGPVLVLDGEAVECRWYPMGEVHEGYSRAGIGQMGERHYLYMSLNHGNQEARWTINQFAQHFAERPVQTAYALDGGQTQEIYFCGSCYSWMDFGVERPVSDIIYFATAIPEALRGNAGTG